MVFRLNFILVSCSSVNISGQYSYTILSPAFTMAVTCQSGYGWTTSPTSGSHTAQCTNVAGSGQWVFAAGETCVGNCNQILLPNIYEFVLVYFSKLFKSAIVTAQEFALNCSLATISGSYVYTVPSPSYVGDLMTVSCPAGSAWTSDPVYSSHNATCTNVSNTGQWVFSDNETCVGIFSIYNIFVDWFLS